MKQEDVNDVQSSLMDSVHRDVDKLRGREFVDAYVRVMTEKFNLSSCCVYEINRWNGHVDISPLSFSSKSHGSLIETVIPGRDLIAWIMNDSGQWSEIPSAIQAGDGLLCQHQAHNASGIALNDHEGRSVGFILYINNEADTNLVQLRQVCEHFAGRCTCEIEGIMLRKRLDKTANDYRYLVETSRDMIWEMGLDGRFIHVNRPAIMIYGYHPDEMKNMHYSRLMASEACNEYESYLRQSVQGNGIYDIVANHINKNGRAIQVIYNAKPKYSVSGELIGYTGTTTDITESVRAQVSIRNNSELLSAILSRMPVVFFRIDENGYLVDIRGQGLNRMGVNDMDWVGRPGYGLFVGMDEMINQALSGNTVHFTSKGSYQGEPWWFYTSMFFDSWTGFGAVGFALDVTEQMQTEEQLVNLLEDNRHLAQRLVEIQEEERRNLSRELHDELGQSITAVKSLATAITAASGDGYSEVRSLGNSIIDLSGRLYDVVSRLMQRLRPDILDSLGFEATINSCIVNSHLEKTGVKCNLRIIGEIEDLDEVVQITVYRIVQECLTNISKYAMASNIDITIERRSIAPGGSADEEQRDELVIAVSDDGIGMDLDGVSPADDARGSRMGLQGMKERVTALGGTLIIDSRPGKGMKINAFIDLIHGHGGHHGDGSRPSGGADPHVLMH